MLLHILSFNERVQKVPVDSWIANIVINRSFEEIGFRRSDFIECCIPAYLIQSPIFISFVLFAFFSNLFRCLIASSNCPENQGD